MFVKPIGNLEWEGPSKEQSARANELMGQIKELFAPFTLPIAKQREEEMAQKVKNLPPLEMPEIPEELEKLLTNPLVQQGLKEYAEAEGLTEPIDWAAVEVDYALNGLVGMWVDVLLLWSDREKALRLSDLDDNMWPISDDPLFNEALESFQSATVLTIDDAHSILHSVKQSLPAGKALPDAIVELLKLDGITITE